MNYTVVLAPEFLQKMRGWGLSQALWREVLDRLFVRLAADPDGLLGGVTVPILAFSYRFVLTNDRAPDGKRLHFFFAIDRDDDARQLAVVGAWLTVEP